MERFTPMPGAQSADSDSIDPEPISDAELISAVRGGDLESYGHLFERHVEAARRLARQLVNGPDSDDLVSDAFAKVLGVLQNGGGPDLAFRAYLLTSVRRLHIDRIRSGSKLQSTDDMTPYDQGVPFTDTAVAGFENATAAKAFASLPERWQQVLWHTEVEGQKPGEIAALLGMSANSVSALAYRAREGLREAFVSMHAQEATEDACALTRTNLGSYIRGGCSRRDAAKVESHLQNCRECTAIYLELTEVNSNLGAVLAPLLLGSAGASYLAAAHLGAAAAAKAGVVGAFERTRDWFLHTPPGRATGGVGVAAAAVLAVALGLQGLQGASDPTAPPEKPVAAPAPSAPAATPAPAPENPAPAAPNSPADPVDPVTAPATPLTPVTPATPTTTTTRPGITLAPLSPVRVPAGATSVQIDLGEGARHLDGTTLRVRSARIMGDHPHGRIRLAAESTATRMAADLPLFPLLARSATASITYIPDPSWRGTETIAYVLGDGQGRRASGTVKVTTPNRVPVAVADRIELHAIYAAAPAVVLDLTGNDRDANGDRLQVTAVSPAGGSAQGSVALVNGQVRYARPIWSGGQVSDVTDTFTYTLSDGHGGTATATVSVVVGLNPNDAPVAPTRQVSTHWATPVSLTPHATDADGDRLTYTATNGSHGTVTLVNGVLTYTPSGAYVGTDTFTYSATDGHSTGTGQVSVTLTNAHPAAGDESPLAISDDEDAVITVPSTDADGDPLTISDVTGAVQSGQGGRTLSWTPTFGINSTHSISYRITDGANSTLVTVPVTATRPSATVSLSSEHPNATTSAQPHHLVLSDLPANRSARVRIELVDGGNRDQHEAERGAECETVSLTPSYVVECDVSDNGYFFHLDFNPSTSWSLSVTATPLDFTGPSATFHLPT